MVCSFSSKSDSGDATRRSRAWSVDASGESFPAEKDVRSLFLIGGAARVLAVRSEGGFGGADRRWEGAARRRKLVVSSSKSSSMFVLVFTFSGGKMVCRFSWGSRYSRTWSRALSVAASCDCFSAVFCCCRKVLDWGLLLFCGAADRWESAW